MRSAGDQTVASASNGPMPIRRRSVHSTVNSPAASSMGIAMTNRRPAVSSPNRAAKGRIRMSTPRLPDQAHLNA